MIDKEKIVNSLKKTLEELDITSPLRLTLIQVIEYLQEVPKFKVGQFICQYGVVAKIVEISEEGYHCDNAFVPFTAQDSWELVEEPVSEDLEKELDNWRHLHFNGRRDKELSGEYLKRSSQLDLAHHFADWQKKQMMKDAIDIIPFDINPNNGIAHFRIREQYGEELTIKSSWIISQGIKVNRKVKLIIIKEE